MIVECIKVTLQINRIIRRIEKVPEQRFQSIRKSHKVALTLIMDFLYMDRAGFSADRHYENSQMGSVSETWFNRWDVNALSLI